MLMPTGDAPHGQHDHSTTEPAIREILASLGLSARGLRWVESYSHSAWMTNEVVVRYRIIGPTGRLTHEAKVAALLPREALYPAVIATGCSGRDDWLVTARVPGVSLPDAWPSLSVDEREAATRDAAAALRAIHGAPAQHLVPPCLFGGAPLVPRHAFVDTLARLARDAPDGDTEDVRRVLALLDDYREVVDDEPQVMAHHDFNFGQCVWRDGHVVAVVDLEMSHANSVDWDLTDFLGTCADSTQGIGTREVVAWFKDTYPEPFAHPSLRQRLRVYDLIYRLAQLMQQPDVASMLSTLEHGTPYEHVLEA